MEDFYLFIQKLLKNRHKIINSSNEELLSFFLQSGNIDAYGELYRRHIPLVYGLCLKYLADKEAAHDAVMDIFEDVLKKLPQYNVLNFKTWLYSVAKNHCLHIIRKGKQINFVKIEETFVEKEEFFTLIEKPQTEDETVALEYCMGTLPSEQQTSINYFYMEEKSYADIVDLTGFPLNKVKSYIQNGKRNLKSCLIKVLGNI